jgi:hypothetical protein
VFSNDDERFDGNNKKLKEDSRGYNKNNINKSNTQSNNNDPFGLFQNDVSYNKINVNNNENQSAQKKVNDIFDIFNQGPVVQNSQNIQNITQNNQNTKNKIDPFNFIQRDNSIDNTNQNINSQQHINTNTSNKGGVDLLAEKLKNAYSNKDDGLNKGMMNANSMVN